MNFRLPCRAEIGCRQGPLLDPAETDIRSLKRDPEALRRRLNGVPMDEPMAVLL